MEKLINKLIAIQLSLTVTFLALVYLVSEYFNENLLDEYLSFKANDGPGYIQPSCVPKPLGIHYFGDFLSTACHSRLPTPYLSEYSSNYFPFAYILMKPFGYFMRFNYKFSVTLFLLLTISLIIIPIWISLSCITETSTKVISIVALVVISYPFFSVIDRGNIQGLVVGFLIIGVLAYQKNHKTTSAIMFAIAATLKGYPIVFFLIYVRKRDWKQLLISTTISLSLTLVSMSTFSGGAYQNLIGLFRKITQLSDTGNSITAYSNSLKALFETILFLKVPIISHLASFLIDHYQVFTMIFSLALVALALQKRISNLEFYSICALLCALLFDPVPGYVLLVFFVPLVVGFSEYKPSDPRISDLYLLLICLLMIPKGLPIKVGNVWPRCDYCPTFNSAVNPTIELVLLTIIVYSVFRKTRIHTEAAKAEVDLD